MSGCRVLLVGGGITSALTAAMLAERAPHLSLSVWDKARGAGGRMSTSRAPSVPKCSADLGAQYISIVDHHDPVYRELVDVGLLEQFSMNNVEGARAGSEDMKHYTSPQGISSLVKHYFNKSKVVVDYNRRVASLTKGEHGGWVVRTMCGLEENFSQVILTIPVPQLLGLGGDFVDNDVKDRLGSVEYSTRYALAMYYASEGVDLGVDWVAKYVDNHPVIRFVTLDNLKRSRTEVPLSVVVHGTVGHGSKFKSSDMEEVKIEMLRELWELFPSWPQPKEVKVLRWLYSQVINPYPGTPGCVELTGGVWGAGDSFVRNSNFGGCLLSARTLVDRVVKSM